MVDYNPSYRTIGSVTATITTNKELKTTPSGWTKIDDTHYTKIFITNETETVTITDLLNNTAMIQVRVTNILDGVVTADGLGYSGVRPLNSLEGNITMKGYSSWPTGFTKGAYAFIGGTYDKNTKDIWMAPYYANQVVKVNAITGAMVGYSGWPSGFSKGNQAFMGGVETNTDIWLVPAAASMVIKINKSTGVMTRI